MIDDRRGWSWLIIATAIGGLLYFLAPALTPFALSALFAYLGNPLVERLAAKRMSRGAAVAIVFLLMTMAVALLLAIIIPALIDQARSVPGYIDALHARYDRVAAPLQSEFGFSLTAIDPGRAFASLRTHLDDIGRFAPKLLGGLTTSGAAVIGWVANVLLIPLITFYLMRDWTHMVERLRLLIPSPAGADGDPTRARIRRRARQFPAWPNERRVRTRAVFFVVAGDLLGMDFFAAVFIVVVDFLVVVTTGSRCISRSLWARSSS